MLSQPCVQRPPLPWDLKFLGLLTGGRCLEEIFNIKAETGT